MFHIIRKEAKEIIADKRIWIGILTVLIIYIIGTSYHIQRTENSNADLLKLGIINKDDSEYSKLLLNYFYRSETFHNFVEIIEGEEAEIIQYYKQGELDVYLEIPENFADNMMNLNHSPVRVTLGSSDTTKAILFQNVLKSYEKYIASVEVSAVGLHELMKAEGRDQTLIKDTNRSLSMDLIFTALGKEEIFDYQPVRQFPSTTLVKYYLASIFVISNLYLGLYIGYRILKEMEQGTLLRIRTTKTSLAQVLLGKWMVPVVLFTIANLIFVLFSLRELTLDATYYCCMLVIYSVCQALLICALSHTTQRYILIGNLLLFYFTIIGGGIIPIQFLPQDILLLSKCTPYYYFLKGLLHLYQGQLNEVGSSMIFLLLISFLFLFLSILLLYSRKSDA